MKKIMIILVAVVVLILTACGQSDDNSNGSSDDVVQSIKADLKVPKQAEKGETLTLAVTVTQDGKQVEDADEVKFEIWKDGMKNGSEMIKANHTGDGKYTVEKTFNKKGIFHVQSHVTARQMHTMPKKEINVGNVTASTDDKSGQKKYDGHH